MADGFKTSSGALAIVGLMGLPLWLWACRYPSITFQHISYAMAIPVALFCLDLVALQVHARESVCIPISWSACDRWTLGMCKRGGLGALCTYQWTFETRQA